MSENEMLEPAAASAEMAPARPLAIAPAPAPSPLMAALEAPEESADELDALLPADLEIAATAAGRSVLDELSAEPAAAAAGIATASDSYGYDEEIAEGGKGFAWPKLGPSAQVGLRMIGCKPWKRVMDRARARYADDTGNIPAAKLDEIFPELLTVGVFAWIKDVVIELGADGRPMPPLADTQANRLMLLKKFAGFQAEMIKVCMNPKNFRDRSDAVLKN